MSSFNGNCKYCNEEMKITYEYKPWTPQEPYEVNYECNNCKAEYYYSEELGEIWETDNQKTFKVYTVEISYNGKTVTLISHNRDFLLGKLSYNELNLNVAKVSEIKEMALKPCEVKTEYNNVFGCAEIKEWE